MNAFVVALFELMLAVAPLSDDERVRLETAIDGRDHREEAFVALLENVRSWNAEAIPGDTPVIVEPNVEAMLVSPDRWRGELCRIDGVIQQRHTLDRPFEGVREWFLRLDDGRPILLFISGLDEPEASRFRDGRRVIAYARFYKRIDAMARDGKQHAYPAFVGRRPVLARAAVGAGGHGILAAIAMPVAGLLVVFLLVWTWSRRRSGRQRVPIATPGESGTEVDDNVPLPDDPCEALGELKRRAEDHD
jgi:hypothetical protein